MMKRSVVIVVAMMVAVALLAAQADKSAPKTGTAKPARASKPLPGAPVKGDPTKTPTGLEYWDLKVGTGPEAAPNDAVLVHYTGWLTSGKQFDSSIVGVANPKPFSFTIGNGDVIKGWDQGVAGMKVGGKRKLRIPSELAYGSRGYPGVIPPNATLIFDVQLVGIKGKK